MAELRFLKPYNCGTISEPYLVGDTKSIRNRCRWAAYYVVAHLHGSGVDYDWHWMDTEHNVQIRNAFHCMDEHGSYCGNAGFSVFFSHKKNVRDFNLTFDSSSSYLASKHMLREYLEEQVYYYVSEAEKEFNSGIREVWYE